MSTTASPPFRLPSTSDFSNELTQNLAEENQLAILIERIHACCINKMLNIVEKELVSHGNLIQIETKAFKNEKEIADSISRKSFDLEELKGSLVCEKSDLIEKISMLKSRYDYGFEVLSIEDLSADSVKINYKWKKHVSDKCLKRVTLLAARIPHREPVLWCDYTDVILSHDGGETYCKDFVNSIRNTISYKHSGGTEATLSEIINAWVVNSTAVFCTGGATFEVHGKYTVVGCHPADKIDILRVSYLVDLRAEEAKSTQEPPLFIVAPHCNPMSKGIWTYTAQWEEGVDYHYPNPITSFEIKEFLKEKGAEFSKGSTDEFLDEKFKEFLKENGALPKYAPNPEYLNTNDDRNLAQFEGRLKDFNDFIRPEIEQYRKEKNQEYEDFYRTTKTSTPISPRKRMRSLAFTNDTSPTFNPAKERKHSIFHKKVVTDLFELFVSGIFKAFAG